MFLGRAGAAPLDMDRAPVEVAGHAQGDPVEAPVSVQVTPDQWAPEEISAHVQ
ncbi:hypothetical protein [Plantactinospora sp. ZYX-F-223]|uniref:hypothetical protein n=1 Tax=Plantactinospora sp. ZYX-F-223 TaxID=3144103 RepID=UPI0031FC1D92